MRPLARVESRAILARNLRRLRSLHGMNQETLADAADMNRSYLSDLENEKFAATVDMLDALAKALKVRASELIDDDVPAQR